MMGMISSIPPVNLIVMPAPDQQGGRLIYDSMLNMRTGYLLMTLSAGTLTSEGAKIDVLVVAASFFLGCSILEVTWLAVGFSWIWVM